MDELENKILNFFRTQPNLNTSDDLLLAISGGADSTAMMHALADLKNTGHLTGKILAVHINHNLRGEKSDQDQQFVTDLAKKLNIPLLTKDVYVRQFANQEKLSIELAARQLRIKALLSLAKENQIRYILTAHHADDNAETLIHRLSRGTGFRGLAGIWPVKNFAQNTYFARPLHAVTRSEILNYLNDNNLTYRQDHTNFDLLFTRNFIRHKLFPALQKNSPSDLVSLLLDLSEKARKLQSKIETQVETLREDIVEFTEDSAVLNASKFKHLHPLVQIQLINKSLDRLKISQRDIKKIHYQNIIHLANLCRTGKKIQLPGKFSVTCQYENLVFSRDSKPAHQNFGFQIPVGQKVTYKNLTIASKVFPAKEVKHTPSKPGKDQFTEWFDFDKLKTSLLLSTPKKGQRFVPLGQTKEKKISRFFIDAKTPRPKRQKSLVISDDEKVIWLWPFRISDNAKTTPQTKNILELRITPTCEYSDVSSQTISPSLGS